MTTISIHVFAILKNYFKPTFEVTITTPTIEHLLHVLIELNPSCETIIKRSRFAIDETIVDLNHKLNSNDKIFILPPSSGG